MLWTASSQLAFNLSDLHKDIGDGIIKTQKRQITMKCKKKKKKNYKNETMKTLLKYYKLK